MASVGEIIAGTTVELTLAALALGLLYRVYHQFIPVPKRVVVPAFHCAVTLRDSHAEKVLEPGTHWIGPKTSFVLCDRRPKPFQVASQNLITADKVAIRISLGGEYKIADPVPFVSGNSDSFGALFLEVRQALFAAAAETDAAAVLSSTTPIVQRMFELVLPRASQLGIEFTMLYILEAVPIGKIQTP